ncbi:cation channel sperm-associated auxiliary subunit beta-like [Meriones unguiculatus]|uniref:cation channel sperm-associated auxiliary subunit beta-like n=1 Tax=Meriones unguiculatus TaxID=10047 RepID=UPI00293F254B|nr:cation channel sperm-associated auxiliary subunit beta-like [Meriones unguiculatus]
MKVQSHLNSSGNFRCSLEVRNFDGAVGLADLVGEIHESFSNTCERCSKIDLTGLILSRLAWRTRHGLYLHDIGACSIFPKSKPVFQTTDFNVTFSVVTFTTSSLQGKKKNHLICFNEGASTDIQMMKLFLSSDNLRVHCFFQSENQVLSRAILSIFTTGGVAPNMIVMNSTYHGDFHFKLSLLSNRAFWLIDIPRENITVNTDIAAVEQWIIKITMHEGLNIYDTEGTLLDLVREPILQWSLGPTMNKTQVKQLYPHVIDIIVTKCPCANDVALLGLILDATSNGVYIGKTISGFWKVDGIIWHDMTKIIYEELKDEHKGLTVIDMVLTNHFLVILTSLGLFISPDLRYPITSHIQLSRAEFCGFERVDYIKGKLWYTERCFANTERFEVDYITITFNRNRTLSESSSCFYSKEPFLEWLPCLDSTYESSTVVTFLIDQESKTGIYLLRHQRSRHVAVSVSMLKEEKPSPRPKFPNFKFPASFSHAVGMVFHPRSHFLYVYGDQVWLSVDGGNTFELLCDFLSNFVRKTVHSFYTSDISFITQNKMIYRTKAGSARYTKMGEINDTVYTLYYDQLGYIHKLTTDRFDTTAPLSGYVTTSSIFGEPPDLGFETALAPQFVSANEMLFFAFVPLNESVKNVYKKKFENIHVGKVLSHSKTGNAYIREIFRHTSGNVGFYSSVLAEIIEPFGMEVINDSPCLDSNLSISIIGPNMVKLSLEPRNYPNVFKDTDVEKTVVIPGHSSFMVIEITDEWTAFAIATMPDTVDSDLTFAAHSWLLYNFGSKSGRNWAIHLKPCNYWVQTDLRSLNAVKYTDMGNKEELKYQVIPNTRGMIPLQIPPVTVIIGNPTLLEVMANGHFDISDDYHMKIQIASKFFHRGSTSLALVLWDASTDCYVTTLVTTMKSSCSYLRTMHHVPDADIPPEDWVSGVHEDSLGFNMIKTLPVNYRPPSNMGISIPLTDNFYHADPSKPIPRNLFQKSKETGKYKQCANATRREMCNCTEHQKGSHAVAFSDCKEKVHRYKFPVTQYPVVLEIFNEGEKFSVEPPYLVTVTEVNMRKNWELKHTVPENLKKLKTYLESRLKTPVYNPLGLNLSIRGSELFHFRVSVVPGVSFCDLAEEFQIYVDEVPLPFPGHTLIAVGTSVVIGGLIFISFLFQLRNIHPLRAFWRHSRGHFAMSSFSSIGS